LIKEQIAIVKKRIKERVKTINEGIEREAKAVAVLHNI